MRKNLKKTACDIFIKRNENFNNDILFWSITFSLFWIAIHYAIGIIFGFKFKYENYFPDAVFSFSTILIFILIREFFRAMAVTFIPCTVKHKFITGIIIAFSFSLAELFVTGFLQTNRFQDSILEFIIYSSVIIAKSALLTSITTTGGMLPAFLYAAVTEAGMLLIPFEPIMNLRAKSLIDIILCMMFLIVMDCAFGKSEEKPLKPKNRKFKAIKISSVCIVAALFLSFFCGFLPWQPVSIATGSMQPEISVGDMVIISKTENDNIEIGDIIQFKRNSYTVVHRVVQITEIDGQKFYTTKGDANNSNDNGLVSSDDIIGKAVAAIPYIGRLSLWIHSDIS